MSTQKVQFVHDPSPDAKLDIWGYVNCVRCIDELPQGTSPSQFARLNAGFTSEGFQVWCVRHNCNVSHVRVQVGSTVESGGKRGVS